MKSRVYHVAGLTGDDALYNGDYQMVKPPGFSDRGYGYINLGVSNPLYPGNPQFKLSVNLTPQGWLYSLVAGYKNYDPPPPVIDTLLDARSGFAQDYTLPLDGWGKITLTKSDGDTIYTATGSGTAAVNGDYGLILNQLYISYYSTFYSAWAKSDDSAIMWHQQPVGGTHTWAIQSANAETYYTSNTVTNDPASVVWTRGTGSNTKPVFVYSFVDTRPPEPANANIDISGTTLTVNWTEDDSAPVIGDVGLTLSNLENGPATLSDVVTSAKKTTATISRVIPSTEFPTLNYTPGNFTDSAASPNAVAAFSDFPITNYSGKSGSGGRFFAFF